MTVNAHMHYIAAYCSAFVAMSLINALLTLMNVKGRLRQEVT